MPFDPNSPNRGPNDYRPDWQPGFSPLNGDPMSPMGKNAFSDPWGPKPGAWQEEFVSNHIRRFMARHFDLMWEMTLVLLPAFGVFLLLRTLSPDPSGLLPVIRGHALATVALWTVACLVPATLLSMVIDAAVHAIFGNTPGKALLGLHVTDEDGDDIGFWKYLGRNMMVLVFGLMFAIPPLSFLLSLVQAGVVIKKGRATYDFQMRTTVSGEDPSVANDLVFIAILVGISVALNFVPASLSVFVSIIHYSSSLMLTLYCYEFLISRKGASWVLDFFTAGF